MRDPMLNERREALERWSARVARLVSGEAADSHCIAAQAQGRVR
jgi:hypothetical protein